MMMKDCNVTLNNVEAASAYPWILLNLVSSKTSSHKILIGLQMILAIKTNTVMCKSKTSSEF